MCGYCYRMYVAEGVPQMTPEMSEIVVLIKKIYATDWGEAGGPLHIQIDDMNLDDRQFEDAHRDYIAVDFDTWYAGAAPEDINLCYEVFDRLRALSPAQRAECVWRAYS